MTRWHKITVLMGLMLWSAQILYAGLGVGRLRIEALQNPVGIDVSHPAFSWTMKAENERGVQQTAYEINLYADRACTENVWSSGKTETDQSVDIAYTGNPLKPSTRYYWKVTVWDNKHREATSSETAYFETGLMGTGWDGAKWIKASHTPLGENPTTDVTAYSIETDIEIENLAAGIVFGAQDDRNYFMWQINLEAGYPRFRPHSWKNGAAVCHDESDLRGLINIELHRTYRLRIIVEGDEARTYIDNILIDSRKNPLGGDYAYGQVGIRQDRALNNYNDLEKAYFDNFVVKDLTDGGEKVLITEDFSETGKMPFSAGSIKDGRLYVEAAYAWYAEQNQVAYDIELDMLIEQDNAAIVFSAYDTQNMHMWAFNVKDASYPILRRHIRTNGTFRSSDVNLGKYFSKQELAGSLHHVRIAVKSGIISTYVDNQLVDSYKDTSGKLHQGAIGFRAYHDKTMNEKAYYDNIKVTAYPEDASDEGEIVFAENFENAGHQFSGGEIEYQGESRMLKVSSSYEENCIMPQSSKGIPLFRKVFQTHGKVKSARIYTSALGVYDVFVNGTRVGCVQPDGTTLYDELKPGWTDYRKEIAYMTYDVTALLREEDNVIGAQVSNGWWGGAIAHGVYGSPSPGFIAKLRIEYEDGSVETVVTDTDWASAYCGPVVDGDIYNGETYDARRECSWSTPEYDASDWFTTVPSTDFSGELVAFNGPSVQIREFLRRTPHTQTIYEGTRATGTAYGMINVVKTQGGTEKLRLKAGQKAIFDMGQNMVGWVRFTAKGQSGTQLTFRFGEMLNDKGDTNRGDDGPGGSVYTYNLRTAKATLRYTLKGSPEGETYQPSASFFGFRYCEVSTTQDVEITGLTGEVVGSAIEESATFETSHPDVNQLYSNVMWGQRGNFLSIPTDCPQRDERLGWTGDTQIFSRAASYNADVRAFFHKWMRDLRNSQREDGAYPDTAPFCNFWGYGNAAWGDAGIIVPWTVYVMFGDTRILKDNYASMTRYMKFLARQSGEGYTYNGAGTSFGDWLAYENMDARYVSVCYYAYVADLMGKIAGVLSETETDSYSREAKRYRALYQNIKREFQKRYVGSNGLLTVSTQTSYLLALKFNLLPESSKEKALEHLRGKIVNNGYKLSTGFVGTGILNQTLSQFGQDDLAYDLLLQRDNPSWLYSVDQGATTIWERWDSYTLETGFNKHPWIMNSFNHYAYGVVSEWMFRYVGGIEADENRPGFKHTILQPTPDNRDFLPSKQERITWAKASHHSAYGEIRSEWHSSPEGHISYTATVPANTTATLYLPLSDASDIVTEGNRDLSEAEGVTFKGVEDNKAIIELQSGTYEFQVRKGDPSTVDTPVSSALRVYPNPVSKRLYIACAGPIVRTSVTSGNGQTVCVQNHGESIDASSWGKGLYVVHVSTPENNYSTKVIKQ